MEAKSPISVIWVGPRGDESFRCLEGKLRSHGVDLTVCEDPGRLPLWLDGAPSAVVVVFDDPEGLRANTALAALESVYRPITVVVVAQESTFGHYYDLMGRGVHHFYKPGEAPERIARAVQQTAARAA